MKIDPKFLVILKNQPSSLDLVKEKAPLILCFLVTSFLMAGLSTIFSYYKNGANLNHQEFMHNQGLLSRNICVDGKLYNVAKYKNKETLDINQLFQVTPQGAEPILCKEEDVND